MHDDPNGIPEEIQAWRDTYGQLTDDSADVLEAVKHWIGTGQVRIEPESDKHYQLLGSKYPIGVNRIDWRGVREHQAFDVLPHEIEAMTADEHKKRLAECRNVVLEWFRSSDIELLDWVVWTGDTTNVSLHMTVQTLLELYPHLFSCLQHHYVLPLTGEWCLNYTIEGQLFFGRAEDALAHGHVDLDSP